MRVLVGSIGAAIAVLGVTTAFAAVGVPCPDGRFIVQGPALVDGSSQQDAVVLSAGRVSVESGCPATVAVVRAPRIGTRVRVKWDPCGSVPGRTRLRAVIEPVGCNLMSGVFRMPKLGVRTSFLAVRDPTPPTTTTTTIPKLAVWRPATVPFDPECRTGCTEVGRTAPLAHTQMQLIIRANPAIDDPIAQWGDCLESVLGCFERDGALAPCVEQAACPAQCKALFRSRAAAAVDENGRVDAFDAVFVDRAAPCRPADEDTP